MNAPVGQELREGVVLVNVGSPDAPTPAAVRRYLREFLGDPKVVDLPAPARWLLLTLVILPFRPRRSAHAYQAIWTKDGAPLLLHANAQAEALRRVLPGVEVEVAMRYGNPSLASALERLAARGVQRVTAVPMYPQYATATTGSTVEAFEALRPDGLVVEPFHARAGFVQAAADRVRETVAASGAELVLFSYHGLPVRQVAPVCAAACEGQKGGHGACAPLHSPNARCYRAQCFATTSAIAAAAGVTRFETSFQSRLKGTTWLGPFTDEVLARLARDGVRRVAVACPSFVADCLETLEEIGQRGAETFCAAGGEALALVPAVNDAPAFIDALAEAVRERWRRGDAS
jgi:ferrochelatase